MDEHRLLHVDADRDRREAVGAGVAAERRFVTDPEPCGGTAVDTLGHESYDAVLVGHPLPDGTVEFVGRVRGGYPDLPIVAYGDDAAGAGVVRALFRAGVTAHVPLTDGEVGTLVDRLDDAIETYHDRQRTRRGAAAFRRLGEAVAGAPTDVDGAVEGVLRSVRATYEVDFAGLARVADGEFRVVAADASRALRDEFAGPIPLEETYCETTVNEGRTVTSDPGGGVDGDGRPAVARRLGLSCYLGTPVTVDGRTYGTLCVVDRTRRRGFAAWERQGIELAARWVARELEHDREKSSLARGDADE
ncbi:GAF domain-containing protein [Halobaculum sp. EA56]|uniref:GAF domain-containing protein n=1 Tax=Halobaculum sp. EA56 TaxID=3421648 RepID=UPI003EC0DA33